MSGFQHYIFSTRQLFSVDFFVHVIIIQTLIHYADSSITGNHILSVFILKSRCLYYPCNLLWKEVKVTQSCVTLCNPPGLYSPWNSPGQNSGVGSLSLLQGIFPTQGSNLGLPHHRWILYHLSHQGTPGILEWVAYPFSRGSS